MALVRPIRASKPPWSAVDFQRAASRPRPASCRSPAARCDRPSAAARVDAHRDTEPVVDRRRRRPCPPTWPSTASTTCGGTPKRSCRAVDTSAGNRAASNRAPCPRRGDARVEIGLAAGPVLEAARPWPKTKSRGPSACSARLGGQDGARLIRQRDDVLAPVLRSGRRQRDGGGVEVDLGPAQGGDLVAARAGQHQQLDDRAVLAITGGAPDRGQFVVGQHALARPFSTALLV